MDVVSTTLRAYFQDFTPAEHLLGHMFEKVQRVPWGGEKRQNIFKSGFEIYFSFYVENGLFSARCHLSSHENGAKVQNRVRFGAF
ncbi:MAG: hypothetical protein ACLT1M_05805 [Christensenellales bacterium]